MNKDVSESVGDPKAGAANRTEDVKTVQGLLNVQTVEDRRSDRFLAVDGSLGSATLAAIGEFQRRHGLPQIGLIKRGDAAIHALASFSGPHGMRASSAGIDLIKGYEHFRSKPYDNDGTAGNTTVGYGHLLHPGIINHSSSEKKFENGITKAEAENLLRGDLATAEGEVNSSVHVPVTQGQFDALVSLAFNVHPGEFRNSTLIKILNRGDYIGALKQFAEWVRVKARSGKYETSRGLEARRTREEEMFGHR
jgi:lysozyme